MIATAAIANIIAHIIYVLTVLAGELVGVFLLFLLSPILYFLGLVFGLSIQLTFLYLASPILLILALFPPTRPFDMLIWKSEEIKQLVWTDCDSVELSLDNIREFYEKAPKKWTLEENAIWYEDPQCGRFCIRLRTKIEAAAYLCWMPKAVRQAKKQREHTETIALMDRIKAEENNKED